MYFLYQENQHFLDELGVTYKGSNYLIFQQTYNMIDIANV